MAVGVAFAAIIVTMIVSSLQTPFVLREALNRGTGSPQTLAGNIEAQWLSAHYKGGNVLAAYATDSSMMFFLMTAHDVPDRAFITDTNGSQFAAALKSPANSVTWIVMSSPPNSGDAPSMVWNTLNPRKDWRPYFVLRKSFDTGVGTMQIYQRSATPLSGPAGTGT